MSGKALKTGLAYCKDHSCAIVTLTAKRSSISEPSLTWNDIYNIFFNYCFEPQFQCPYGNNNNIFVCCVIRLSIRAIYMQY